MKDVEPTEADFEAYSSALNALEAAYPRGPESQNFEMFQVPGSKQDQVILLMVSVGTRIWSSHFHLEMKVILGSLEHVNLPLACSMAGMLRGGVVIHEKSPFPVMYQESWPLPDVDPADVVQTALALGMAAGFYHSS